MRGGGVELSVLAAVFLVAVGLPEVMDLSAEWLVALDYIAWVVWAAFAFELVVKRAEDDRLSEIIERLERLELALSERASPSAD